MSIFGFILIRKKDLKEYQRKAIQHQKIHECYRWLSGWKDLDIIWEYIISETYFGNVSTMRKKYAEARGTNEYGQPR